ncbi:MAG: hypothetical protein MUF54_10030 [Polyangiaceae bacterium]|jgi:hypothetical protein|nr:hypothetical protein [Polyangiaceae bacterium]
MKAVAIVRVDPAVVKEALAAAPKEASEALGGAGFDVRLGDDDRPHKLLYFEDATAIHLGMGMEEASADAVAGALEAALGGLLGMHDDPRGVPVYPDTYALDGRTWAQVAEELGDAADWVPIGVTEVIADPMAELLGDWGPGAADLSRLTAQLQGQDPGVVMRQAMQMAQQLAASGALHDIQRAMEQMMQGPPAQERRASGEPQVQAPNGMAGLGLDLTALAQQAQEMLNADPELQKRLQEQLGQLLGAAGVPDEGEAAGEASIEVVDAELAECDEKWDK